ncbi:MAG: methyltransferase domain-containing protein [Candidatus Hodarchaeales archaeon]|jgi:ubiquinone/menaquinone biosynthesis C-methylase UbiE
MTLNHDLLGGSTDFKTACCNFYEQDILKLLLGDSLHPGGLELTKNLGKQLRLQPNDTVLDLASGLGTSACFLAEEFGSSFIGLDLSRKNVNEANRAAQKRGLDNVKFEVGDAITLPFQDDFFDVVISECSFCIFPNKNVAAKEMYRILKPKGRLGMSDVAIEGKLPFSAQDLLLRIACIADALSIQGYKDVFEKVGFKITSVIDERKFVLKTFEEIKKKIFLAELAIGLKKIDIGVLDIKKAKSWLKEGQRLVNEGYGTYITIIGIKSFSSNL